MNYDLSCQVDIKSNNGGIEHEEKWLQLEGRSTLHDSRSPDHHGDVEGDEGEGGEGGLHPQPVPHTRVWRGGEQ